MAESALQHERYGIRTTVALPYPRAVEQTSAALAAEGFGILSEIDVSATLQKKLGVAFRPYVILGACNPPLAHRALSADIDLGLLLPCNVIVYAGDAADESVVAAMDPEPVLALADNDTVAEVARDARERLVRALSSLTAAA